MDIGLLAVKFRTSHLELRQREYKCEAVRLSTTRMQFMGVSISHTPVSALKAVHFLYVVHFFERPLNEAGKM